MDMQSNMKDPGVRSSWLHDTVPVCMVYLILCLQLFALKCGQLCLYHGYYQTLSWSSIELESADLREEIDTSSCANLHSCSGLLQGTLAVTVMCCLDFRSEVLAYIFTSNQC